MLCYSAVGVRVAGTVYLLLSYEGCPVQESNRILQISIPVASLVMKAECSTRKTGFGGKGQQPYIINILSHV